MTAKAARKILRKYSHQMTLHKLGIAYVNPSTIKLWKKATVAALRD